MTEITQPEREALATINEPLKVSCRICTREIGETDNPLHVLDLCSSCKARWIKEMEQEQRKLRYNQMVMGLVMDAAMKPRRVK